MFQNIRDTSGVNSGAFHRRDILLASTGAAVASALGSTALMQITQAQAQSAQGAAKTPITEQEARAIGVNAYLYFYPLVTMGITRRVGTNVEAGKIPGFGPPNMFHSFTAFPAADFKSVVRPNFDTLYSSAFLDLTKEPVIVSGVRLTRLAHDGHSGGKLPHHSTRLDRRHSFGNDTHRRSDALCVDYRADKNGWTAGLRCSSQDTSRLQNHATLAKLFAANSHD